MKKMSSDNKILVNSIKNKGVFNLIRKNPSLLYRAFRKILPTVEYKTLAGIKVQKVKVGDKIVPLTWLPFKEFNKPKYESALIEGLKKYVSVGGKVVVVGGGMGVTTCIASKIVGENGSVICYEASSQHYEYVKRTLSYNELYDNVEVINKCVGNPIAVSGEMSRNKIVKPENLPECNVLELDCEGAEKEILKKMQIKPKTILVETHGQHDSPSSVIKGILKDLNYKIDMEKVAEEDQENFCIENDIKVIWATLKNGVRNNNNRKTKTF